jgi:AcrR family transcriptional regulator
MSQIDNLAAETPTHKPGRPRRGTEAERMEALVRAATKIFLKEGYGLASIDKIATEAGISTRTIYERFKNKGELLSAVISRLIDRDMQSIAEVGELDLMEPEQALTLIGRTVASRLADPESAALYRIVATESQRFPELTAKVRAGGKAHLDVVLAGYLRRQMQRGVFLPDDPARAAALFTHMITAELQECLLFKSQESIGALDQRDHVARVVRLFLFGATPRRDRPANSATRPGNAHR